MSDEQVIDTPPEVETQAREMGWRPKEEFRGDESKWVDAKTFVERGEHVLPIVKATNERLRSELVAANERTARLEAAVRESQESVKALEKHHSEVLKQKVAEARDRLRKELIEAKKEGNVEDEVRLTEELTGLATAEADAAARERNAAAAAADRKNGSAPQEKDYTQEPDFVSWRQDNSWFMTDRAKTAIAYDVTARLRAEGDRTVGRAFLDKVTAEVNKEVARLGGGRPAQSRVEGGKGGAGGSAGSGRGRSYADLPADAKAACDSYARDLVGPNRAYKTIDDWRKYYVNSYFEEV